MFRYSPRLLRLPPLQVNPVIKAFRARSSAVESRYADKIQQRLAECVPTVKKQWHLDLKEFAGEVLRI